MSRAVERAAGALKPNQHPPRCAPSTAQVYQKRHWAERELAKASSRPEDLSACLQSRARSLGTMVTLRAQINRRPLATLLVAIPLTVAIFSYMINVIERVSRASGHFGKQFNANHAACSRFTCLHRLCRLWFPRSHHRLGSKEHLVTLPPCAGHTAPLASTNCTWLMQLLHHRFVVVTLTTAGYGDAYPSTPHGYYPAIVEGIVGMVLTSLLVAVVIEKVRKACFQGIISTGVCVTALHNVFGTTRQTDHASGPGYGVAAAG